MPQVLLFIQHLQEMNQHKLDVISRILLPCTCLTIVAVSLTLLPCLFLHCFHRTFQLQRGLQLGNKISALMQTLLTLLKARISILGMWLYYHINIATEVSKNTAMPKLLQYLTPYSHCLYQELPPTTKSSRLPVDLGDLHFTRCFGYSPHSY